MTTSAVRPTISALAPQLRQGQITPREILETCLARIDARESTVAAWAYLDREWARREADRLGAELRQGRDRGLLHGIPLGIKDIVDVFDMPTGCGSKLWATSYARQDSLAVERLREAGAIILGKTVTTAYAYLDPPKTTNPWGKDHTPGGSSSGSGAAVGDGMILGAVGSQTGGSVIRPASFCGAFGLKPTWGRLPLTGVLPLAPSFDHLGAMANSARDLAEIFAVMADEGPALHGTRAPLLTIPDYFAERLDPVMTAVYEEVQKLLAGAGWSVEVDARRWNWNDLLQTHRTVYSYEVQRNHADRFSRHPDDYPPKIAEWIRNGGDIDTDDVRIGYEQVASVRDTVDASWPGDGVLLLPAVTGPAPDRSTTGDPGPQSPWSLIGLPVVSLPIFPAGGGLPVAVQVVGRRGSDAHLLAVAEAIETSLGLKPLLPPGG